MSEKLIKQLTERIIEKASRDAADDDEDFLVVECVGSNVDDAYALGFEDGAIDFARTLWAIIKEAQGNES